MGNLKDLTAKIKAQQSGNEISEKIEIPIPIVEDEKKEVQKEKIISKTILDEKIDKQSKKNEALISKIKASNKDSKSAENMIHTRLEDKALMKLKILTAYGLSTQSIVGFLVNEFLEKEEVKSLIKKTIENELE